MIFKCFNFLLNNSFPSAAILFFSSLIDVRIIFLALDVATKSSQLAVGLDFSDVIISIESPLLNFLDSGTNLPFTLAPLVLLPISVWMLNAKSNAVESFGRDFNSPTGVKTKISSE